MKVCILAAGLGTRMGPYQTGTHKSLLPLGEKAIISRIIEQWDPVSTEYVIAVGHLAEEIKDFIATAHPSLSVTYHIVSNFSGPGAGPGRSLLACRYSLQEPFFFSACDSLVNGDLSQIKSNWIGVKRVPDPENWCSAVIDSQSHVSSLYYKTHSAATHAFTGVAFVSDWQDFWLGLEAGLAENEESQVDPGLIALIPHGLVACELQWMDTGNLHAYQQALNAFEPTLSSTQKWTDFTYRYGHYIVKLASSESAATKRYKRAELLAPCIPPPSRLNGRCYAYPFVEGRPLTEQLNSKRCHAFLSWAQTELWTAPPAAIPTNIFADATHRFYYDKTLGRLRDYLEQRNLPNESKLPDRVNGTRCPTVSESLAAIVEQLNGAAQACRIHGDLHSGNVLVTEYGYRLIDWREDFGGLAEVGDRYYDLAKFYHTLDLSVEAMENGNYRIAQTADNTVELAHERADWQREAEAAFWTFVQEQPYLRSNVQLLDGLILVNMAPLYRETLGDYLYFLGRYKLATNLHTQ